MNYIRSDYENSSTAKLLGPIITIRPVKQKNVATLQKKEPRATKEK